MAIPDYDALGNLPEGDHEATLTEVKERYAYNFRRREIYDGLTHVVGLLRLKAVETVWLDGSYVTSKIRPSDADVIFVPPAGQDTTTWDLLSPVRRADLKRYYRVDLWEFPSCGRHGRSFSKSMTIKEFFGSDENDQPKGMILLVWEG